MQHVSLGPQPKNERLEGDEDVATWAKGFKHARKGKEGLFILLIQLDFRRCEGKGNVNARKKSIEKREGGTR